MNGIKYIILSPIVGLIITTFFDKKISYIVRELTSYIAKSIFKYWFITLSTIITISGLNYLTKYKYIGEYLSLKFILITVLTSTLASTIYSLIKEYRRKSESPNIAIYCCTSIKDDGYLIMDVNSEKITCHIKTIIDQIKSEINTSSCPYSNGLLDINIESFPDFLLTLFGYKKLNDIIKRRTLDRHLAAILFIWNASLERMDIDLHFNPERINQDQLLYESFERIKKISYTTIDNYTYITVCIKSLFFMFENIFDGLLIDEKKFHDIHLILDDTDLLINDLKVVANSLNSNEFNEFISYWSGYSQKLRAMVLIEQNEMFGAIEYIFKSINCNPYYPYYTYQSLKKDYNKVYAIKLISEMNECRKIVNTKGDDNIGNEVLIQNFNNQLMNSDPDFNYWALRQIIKDDISDKYGKIIERRLYSLDQSNPFILLTIYEVIKFIKKGTRICNNIYFDRIDECIYLLNKITELDNDFPIIYTKIALLMMIKGSFLDDRNIILEAENVYNRGLYIMTQLGIKTRNDSISESVPS